jgi:hypothetical protein
VGGDGGSPGLERYRLAKAGLAEVELTDRIGQTVPIAEIEGTLQQFSSLMRQTGESLRRVCGAEAFQIFDDGIVAAMRIPQRLFRPPAVEGDSDAA